MPFTATSEHFFTDGKGYEYPVQGTYVGPELPDDPYEPIQYADTNGPMFIRHKSIVDYLTRDDLSE